MWVGDQRCFTPGKDPVPSVQEAGCAPGPVWTGMENLAPPTRIQSPDRPARSELQYWLSYPGPVKKPYCIESPFYYLILCYHNTIYNIDCIIFTW
jgi:hypothetical protein